MPEHFDVVVVGAGLSGISAAVHLQTSLPGKSYAVLEARESIGGTWDLFRYPGIRSDSDMFTLGYSFKPWTEGRTLADGPLIRDYIRETAGEYGVEDRIRFGHRVVRASWDTARARWTLELEITGESEPRLMTCSFLHWCSGYYRYDHGYQPAFEGAEDFRGTLVHPQHWPEGHDYAGKRVVVIGSGATAVTLVPTMAREAAHVTMLQRSPSYAVSLPGRDPLVEWARRRFSPRRSYAIARWKAISVTGLSYWLSRRRPELLKRLLRRGLERELPPGYDIDRHFSPSYDPWDQRLCVVPNGDLFRAIREGRASVVTDRIERFTEHGIRLHSGDELEAEVIVTATGLELQMLGGAEVVVDGEEVSPGDTVAYKGMMFSGIPNMALSIGYTNASWTLKCDLICEYVCRLLEHMDTCGYDYCVPVAPPAGEPLEPLIDFSSGYVKRALPMLPKQGSRPPWRLHQNYFRDLALYRRAPLEDEGMRFCRVAESEVARIAVGDLDRAAA